VTGDRRTRTRSHAERLAGTDGYFAPDSVIRRVGNTPVVPFLGGGSAVLLQVAHPLVAAGVAAHSSYDRDLWRRLVRTLRALYFITYGSREEADRVAGAVRSAHAAVRGTTERRLGGFPPGTPYSAEQPELMLWVHATLVHCSLAAYQRFERPLEAVDQERYHREMALVAELFGTPAGVVPETLAELQAYFTAQIESATITVTEPARAVAAAVLRPPLPGLVRMVTPAHRLATTALLPPRIAREYGLELTAVRRPLVGVAGHSLRFGAWPVLRIASHLRPSSNIFAP
jgi:uncharacterized protein (DUF2236 family)